MWEALAIEYFQAFERKDIVCLRTMFSDDVRLTDWDVDVSGIDAVLAIDSNLFASVDSISVFPTSIFVCDNVAIAELVIKIDGVVTVRVVDILEFDAQKKIKTVRAYKG